MDLRQFIAAAGAAGYLITIDREVDPYLEMARVIAEHDGRPVLFERVKGSAYRVVAGVCSDRRYFGLALDTSPDRLLFKLADAVSSARHFGSAWHLTHSTAPCQEVVEPVVDLEALPFLTHYPDDAGPYATAAVACIDDPDTGPNASFHRLLRLDRTRLAARLVEGRGTHTAWRKSAGDLPVALCIGLPLHVLLAASMSPPPGVDELTIAQALAPTPVATLEPYPEPVKGQSLAVRGPHRPDRPEVWAQAGPEPVKGQSLAVRGPHRPDRPEVWAQAGPEPVKGQSLAVRGPHRPDRPEVWAQAGPELVEGLSRNGIRVPAAAEFVLEGRITHELVDEGPFVDLTGTYDIVRRQPVIEIDRITHRRDAIYQALLPGRLEHKLLMGMPREPTIYAEVNQVARCLNVHITPGGASWLHAVVQIAKQAPDDGRRAIEAAFRGHGSLKHIVVVDEDVDIFDPHAVEWAIATRFQADRDLLVFADQPSSSLDPSAWHVPGQKSRTAKMGLDATIPWDTPSGPSRPGAYRRVKRR